MANTRNHKPSLCTIGDSLLITAGGPSYGERASVVLTRKQLRDIASTAGLFAEQEKAFEERLRAEKKAAASEAWTQAFNFSAGVCAARQLVETIRDAGADFERRCDIAEGSIRFAASQDGEQPGFMRGFAVSLAAEVEAISRVSEELAFENTELRVRH